MEITIWRPDSFIEAKCYYENNWKNGQKKAIEKLKEIKNELQEQARILSIGTITYSSVGLVGGCLTVAGIIAAPFTAGLSVVLTVAGIATGVTSGVAGVTHGAVKFEIVKHLCEDAKTSLEQHHAPCIEMRNMLKVLKEEVEDEYKKTKNDFTGNANNAARVIKLCTALADIIPSAAKDVSKGVAKISTKAFGVLVAIGILADLGSLISNSIGLSKFNDGKLCPEAQKLQDVINQMECECNYLAKIFE